MISVTGRPLFRDFLKAQLYHQRPRTVLVALVLISAALLVWYLSGHLIALWFALVFLLVIRPLYIRVRLTQEWDQTPGLHQGQKTYGLDNTGLHAEDDEGRPTVRHWDGFLKFRESRDTFFLYLSPDLYIFLSKRFMTPEQQEEVRRIGIEKIGNKQKLVSRVVWGLLMLLFSMGLTARVVNKLTTFDDNSYYAASVQHILDECIEALENNETNLLQRLKEFKAGQILTYQNRGDLLEHARTFHHVRQDAESGGEPAGDD